MCFIEHFIVAILLIAMVDLSIICDSIIVLMCNSLVMFMSYFCIKIKLKVLIHPIDNKNVKSKPLYTNHIHIDILR
jgi:hypothetical protein